MLTSDYAIIGANGVILRMGTCSQESLAVQAGQDETLVTAGLEGIADDTHYWDGSEFVEYPPKPSQWHQWDGQSWIDNRTPADLDAELEARRAAASLSRCDAVLAAVNAGIILPEEAGEAARGQVPPSLTSALSSLPPEMQLEAEVRWSGSTVIERTNPILIAMAQAKGITDAQLDELFGVEPDAE